MSEVAFIEHQVEAAVLTSTGTVRDHNEDSCGVYLESATCAVIAVADGVSQCAGGEVASQMAVEVTVRAFREGPQAQGAGKRLYRAVQQANIEVYDRSIAVPELQGMSTTLTAVTLERGELTAVHVGDSRLYLARGRQITQITKDHTVAAEKVRFGLMSEERARTSEDRCALTRSLGRELIVARDRTARRMAQGEALLLCSDGLYNVLSDAEMARLIDGRDAAGACRALIDAANGRGSPDNVTAAVVRMVGPSPELPRPPGFSAALRRWLGRSGG